MGTPLADALADYRDQLAPAAADGARPRRWWWWLLLGMVGLIQVGDAPANLDAARTAKMSKKARERMDAEIAQVQ